MVREVTDYADYTGRTDAVLAVNVRARATGYLLQTRFEEGAEVKEDDLLFQIDPQPYQIQKEQAARLGCPGGGLPQECQGSVGG